MTPDDVVRIPSDKRGPGSGLPRHPKTNAENVPRQGKLWAHVPVCDAGGGVWGCFPTRFLAWALRVLGSPRPERTLHVCSGSLTSAAPGVRVDIRADMGPDVVADGRKLPFRCEYFDAVLLDPPWSVEYAKNLYQTEYPRPRHLLTEACRVVRPGGVIAIVHFLVPKPPRGATIESIHGITQGCDYRIRALTLYRKGQRSLFEETR